MLKFFRTIRKKLIEHLSAGRAEVDIRKYVFYALNEIEQRKEK